MEQNLMSAELTADDVKAIMDAFALIKSKMPFLSAMQKADVSGYFKIGNSYQPFLEKIYQTVEAHPEILPLIFDKEEFLRDHALYTTLTPIMNQAQELCEGIQKTVTAAGSDSLVAALDVYASIKQNKDKVPGLSVMHEEMAPFFRRAKAKAVSTSLKTE